MDGRRKALIVANDEYDHDGLRHLLSPAADAEALANVLGDPQIGDFEVETVRNQPSHVIQTHIEDLLADSRTDDVLLLHFSCHGLKSEAGELFFAARNTRPNRLSSTAISAGFVQRCMGASRSRSIVLLLDCCYGGAFGTGVTVRSTGDINVSDSFPENRVGGGRGRAVITASSSIEYAFEGDQLADDNTQRPSVFTTALVEGLSTGDADRDEDGWVSLNELYDYVFDRVRAQTPHQTPSRDVEMQGDLYVARSRRRRIKPTPIPADLQAAMTDPNMFSRLGAVSELRMRLLGENLPSAVGAYEALVEIARSDIQYVADPAARAVQEAAVQPSTTEVRFRPVQVGAERPDLAVRLLGPPIAQAAAPHAGEPWIHIKDETAEGFTVSVETTSPGSRTGTVTLKGPTGELVLPVSSTVTPRTVESIRPVQPPEPALQPITPPTPTAPAPTAPTVNVPKVTAPPAERLPPPTVDPTATPAPEPAATDRTGSKGHAAASVVWALTPLLSFGILAPAPFIHAARKCKTAHLRWVAAAYGALWVVLMGVIGAVPQLGGLLWLYAVPATIHAFVLRRRVFAPSATAASVSTDSGSRVMPMAGTQPSRERGTAASPEVPHFRVVALGVAGSGKTVYLSSMFHTVHVPMPGRSYFLETTAAHRVYLSSVFDEVSDTAEPWPRGTRTGETRELDFDCVSFEAGVKHRVFKISYLDYAGELLESEQEGGSRALGDLEERIRNAHGLLGMLDGYRVLQYLRNEPAGQRYFRSQIQPMTGIMGGASCPIHFVLTKWDLVRGFGEPNDADDNTRLSLVRAALLETAHLRALIETHSWEGRVIRLVPVSAVGPHFAQIDSNGQVLKLPNGEINPTNVEVPLMAILPDLFRQVELSLDIPTRARLAKEARRRRGLTDADSSRMLGKLAHGPPGSALREKLQGVVGGSSGAAVMGMFLDWIAGMSNDEIRAPGQARREERRLPLTIEAARARVLTDFGVELVRLEERLPASRLSRR